MLQNITLASLHLYTFYPIEKAIVGILAELACARFNLALVIPTVERDKRVSKPRATISSLMQILISHSN